MLRPWLAPLLVLGCRSDPPPTDKDEPPAPPEAPTVDEPVPPPEKAPIAAAADGAPLSIEPGGFTPVEAASDAASGRTRYSSPPGSGCMAQVHWWRPMPPDPGGPMAEASRRPVIVDGRETHVITTSMFEGRERQVDAVFLRGDAYQIRILFEGCGDAEEDGFLAGVRITG